MAQAYYTIALDTRQTTRVSYCTSMRGSAYYVTNCHFTGIVSRGNPASTLILIRYNGTCHQRTSTADSGRLIYQNYSRAVISLSHLYSYHAPLVCLSLKVGTVVTTTVAVHATMITTIQQKNRDLDYTSRYALRIWYSQRS